MVIFSLDKQKKEYSMLQNSQVWLVVTWSADFESRLMPRSGLGLLLIVLAEDDTKSDKNFA